MSAATPYDQQFLQLVLSKLVDQPKSIKISRSADALGILLEFGVDSGDIGKVIGKGGRTINALRTLVKACGSKHDERINLRFNSH